MNGIGGIVFATIMLVSAIYGYVGTIWGDLAERRYEKRMKSALSFFLMPGKLANREVWIRHQKFMAHVILAIIFLTYVAILGSILGQP